MLRERLRQITETPDVNAHAGMLEGLSNEIQNTIQIVESEFPIDSYTCLIYVLDFIDEQLYIDVAASGFGRIFAGTDFMNYLLDNNYLVEITEEDVVVDDIIAYFDADEFKHIGKIENGDRIISKWGIGNLYEHSIFEVPMQYGNNIRYYRNLDKETALDCFVEYAKLNGIKFYE